MGCRPKQSGTLKAAHAALMAANSLNIAAWAGLDTLVMPFVIDDVDESSLLPKDITALSRDGGRTWEKQNHPESDLCWPIKLIHGCLWIAIGLIDSKQPLNPAYVPGKQPYYLKSVNYYGA